MHARRFAVVGLAAALVTSGQLVTATLTGPAAAAPSTASANPLATALQADAGGKAVVVPGEKGHARLVGTKRGGAIRVAGGSAARPDATARTFLGKYGSLFGVRDQARSLRLTKVVKRGKGRQAVRYQQLDGGVPTLGGELVVTLDAAGRVLSAAGETGRTPAASATRVSAARARARALAVTAKANRGARGLRAGAASLANYDPAVLGVPGSAPARRVWRVEVTNRTDVRELVLVDAATGGIAFHANQVADATATQLVCDGVNRHDVMASGESVCSTTASYAKPVTAPGTAPLGTDVRTAYDYAARTFDFYYGVLGRNSIDGQGLTIRSTVRYCLHDAPGDAPSPCPMKNAFWNGSQMYYGEGYAQADDVVAHELTHGVTQYDSNLFYFYESGAINESLSDVFGELVDQANDDSATNSRDTASYNWQVGEDLPSGAVRDMKTPATFGQPATTADTRWDLDPDFLDNGGVHTNSGVGNKAAQLIGDKLGVTDTARLYYDVQSNILTSGSDYRDLAAGLQQACRVDLTLDSLKCADVDSAIAATKMNLRPAKLPRHATVTPCPGAVEQTTISSDDMEGSGVTSRWTAGSFWTARGELTYPYATSGTNELYADDSVAPNGGTSYMVRSSSQAFTVPADQETYLLFDHAYELEWYPENPMTGARTPVYLEGGRVQYSVDNVNWVDANSLIVNNRYDHTVRDLIHTSLPSYAAFAGSSSGYITSQLRLTGLAGKTVRLRFLLTTDDDFGFGGWWIDDLRAVKCKLPPSPAVTPSGLTPTLAALSWSNYPTYPGLMSQTLDANPVGAGNNPDPVTLSTTAHSATVGGLSPNVPYTFTLSQTNEHGSGSRTVRLDPALIASSASSTVPYGSVARVSGVVYNATTRAPAPNQPVRLFRRYVGTTAWAYVGSTRTAANGTYVLSPKPAAHAQWLARVYGSSTLLGQDAPIRTTYVSSTASAAFSRTSAPLGTTVALAGSVAPRASGRRVYVQRYVSGRWGNVTSTVVTSTSRYTAYVRPSVRGTFSYRVYVPADATHSAGVSPTRTLRVT